MTVERTEKSLSAENTFTGSKVFYGDFNLNISGDWMGFITVQRRFPEDEFNGSHTGAANQAVLTDTKQAWIADGLIGMYIVNETDGSQAEIEDNTETTITATLAGGSENDWDNGDKYTIWRDVNSGIFGFNADDVGNELESGVFYRAGFKTGDYTSGTATIRISK